MVSLNELSRAFWADSRHAGNAVGRIALKRLNLDHFLRCHAVIHFDFLFIIQGDQRLPHFGGSEANGHVRRNKLKAVAVSRGEDAAAAAVFAGLCQRAENIVCLKSFALHQPVAEQSEQFLERGHLLRQFRRHSLAVCLVACVFLVAEGGGAHIKCHSHGIRLRFRHQAVEDGEKAVNSIGVQAFFRCKKADAVECPVQDAVAVQY